MNIEHILKRIREKGVDAIEDETLEIKSFREISDEFKRSLRRISVCFANTDGGWIILGISESTDSIEGCPEIDPMELASVIYEGTRPNILVQFDSYRTRDGRILYYGRVPRSPRIHATSEGGRYHRVGKRCVPLYPDDELRLLVQRGGLDVSAQPVEGIGSDDMDDQAMEVLRKLRRKTRGDGKERPAIEEPGDEALLSSIGATVECDGGRHVPNLAADILLAPKSKLEPFVPMRQIVYTLMRSQTQYSLKRTWDGPSLPAIDEILGLVESNSGVTSVLSGAVQLDIPDIPLAAIRELLVNAIVHRDYMTNAAIHIQQFKDRIEISNPGGFIGGITTQNILHYYPCHRNPKLVELMHHIGLVEEIGVGVDRIYETLLSLGKEPPIYESTEHMVKVTVRIKALDAHFFTFAQEMSDVGAGLALDELLLLNHVKRNGVIDQHEGALISQRSKTLAHEILTGMVEKGFLVPFGRRDEGRFGLSEQAARKLGVDQRMLGPSTFGKERTRTIVIEAARSKGKISNSDVQGLLGIDRNKATRLLRSLVNEGRLVREGFGKGTRYSPKGQRMP
jgi:ATP-dependent DNA helicase RecG